MLLLIGVMEHSFDERVWQALLERLGAEAAADATARTPHTGEASTIAALIGGGAALLGS